MLSIFDPLLDLCKQLKFGNVLVRIQVRNGLAFKLSIVEANQEWTVQDVEPPKKSEGTGKV